MIVGFVVQAIGKTTAGRTRPVAIAVTPVRIRAMIQGATNAPTRPEAAAIESTRPIAAGCTPARTRRRVTVTSASVTEKLIAAPHVRIARVTACLHTNPRPSVTSARIDARLPSEGGAGSGWRTQMIETAENA